MKNLSSNSSIKSISVFLFSLALILGISYQSKAQKRYVLNPNSMEKLYKELEKRTDCDFTISSVEFYNIILSYSYTESSKFYYPQPKKDTVFITKHDTVWMPPQTAAIPSQDEIKIAQKILKKIIQDQDLSELLQEVIKDMSSKEIQDFRKELADAIKDMNQQLKREKNKRLIAELEAKRARKELVRANKKADRKAAKDKWKNLSKAEKKELTKAKIAEIATETATGLKDGALVAGIAAGGTVLAAGALAVGTLVVIGGIVAKGAIAIGKGIITGVTAIWTWINDRFYVRIDLSCAEQRRIKHNQKYLNVVNKNKPIIKYKGDCPRL